MRFLIIIKMLLMAAVPAAPAQTGVQQESPDVKKRYIYQWTDSAGGVHITDDLGDVPERYRSKARKIEARKPAESGGEQQVQENPESPDSEAAGVEEDAKAEWQQRLRDWKNRLANAEKRYQDLDQERTELLGRWGSAAYAPIEDRLKAQQIEQKMKDLQREIDNARDMVEVTIPEEARKAGVPPGWLRE